MQTEPAARRLDAVVTLLEHHGQEHLLAGLDRADEDRVASFVMQVEAIDFDEIASLSVPEVAVRTSIRTPSAGGGTAAPRARSHPSGGGEQLISDGSVAAFTVAGGQGTRLGWNGPKGTFPATPITGKPLFRVFAEQLTAVDRRYGVETPWYLMTSPLNDEATRSFFADNNFFGRNPDSIQMFPQGVMPAVDDRGRLMLAEPGVLAVSPDGHGDSLRALHRSGALEHARSRGVRHPAISRSTTRRSGPSTSVPRPARGTSGIVRRDVEQDGPQGERREKVGCSAAWGTHPGHRVQRSAREPRRGHRSGRSTPLHRRIDRDPRAGGRLHRAPHRPRLRGPTPVSSGAEEGALLGSGFGPTGRTRRTQRDQVRDVRLRCAPLRAGRARVRDGSGRGVRVKNAEGTDSAVSSGELQTERAARWMERAGEDPRADDGTVDGRIEIVPTTAMEAGDLNGRSLGDDRRRGSRPLIRGDASGPARPQIPNHELGLLATPPTIDVGAAHQVDRAGPQAFSIASMVAHPEQTPFRTRRPGPGTWICRVLRSPPTHRVSIGFTPRSTTTGLGCP